MNDSTRKPRYLFGMIGATVGGVVGFYVFHWLIKQGFYALIIPGGLLGVTAGYGIRDRSQPFAIACGIAGLVLGLYSEWTFSTFVVDNSFYYMVTHVHEKKPLTLIMLVIGTIISYRLALGLDRASETGNSKN